MSKLMLLLIALLFSPNLCMSMGCNAAANIEVQIMNISSYAPPSDILRCIRNGCVNTSLEIPIRDGTTVLNIKEFVKDNAKITIEQQEKFYVGRSPYRENVLSNNTKIKDIMRKYNTCEFAIWVSYADEANLPLEENLSLKDEEKTELSQEELKLIIKVCEWQNKKRFYQICGFDIDPQFPVFREEELLPEKFDDDLSEEIDQQASAESSFFHQVSQNLIRRRKNKVLPCAIFSQKLSQSFGKIKAE